MLERTTAVVGQRVDDLRTQVNSLAPLLVNVTRLESSAATLAIEITNIRRDLAERDKERDREGRVEARTIRVALWSLTGAIITTIVGAVLAYLLSNG